MKGRTPVYLQDGGKHTVNCMVPSTTRSPMRDKLASISTVRVPSAVALRSLSSLPCVPCPLSFPTGVFSHFPTVCLPSLSQYEESNLGHFCTKEVLCRLTILAGAGLYLDYLPATARKALPPCWMYLTNPRSRCEPQAGIEPATFSLQVRHSTN